MLSCCGAWQEYVPILFRESIRHFPLSGTHSNRVTGLYPNTLKMSGKVAARPSDTM